MLVDGVNEGRTKLVIVNCKGRVNESLLTTMLLLAYTTQAAPAGSEQAAAIVPNSFGKLIITDLNPAPLTLFIFICKLLFSNKLPLLNEYEDTLIDPVPTFCCGIGLPAFVQSIAACKLLAYRSICNEYGYNEGKLLYGVTVKRVCNKFDNELYCNNACNLFPNTVHYTLIKFELIGAH